MKKLITQTLIASASLSILLASSFVHAQQSKSSSSSAVSAQKPIMKITTSSGEVIYTDRSLQGVTVKTVESLRGAISEKVLAQSAGAVTAQAPQSKASDAKPASLVDWAKGQEAAMEKQSKQVAEAKKSIAKVNCEQAKVASAEAEKGRVAKLNDKGEPEFLTDEQLAAEKNKLQSQIKENCL